MSLDAIIISDPGGEGTTGILPERLMLDGRPSSIQVVCNYLENRGKIVPPVGGDGERSWWSARKLNGIYLSSYLSGRGFRVDVVNRYFRDKDRFQRLLRQNPRAVVISTTFIRDKQALRDLVQDIRSLAPDIFIIAGGSFVYLSYLVMIRSGEKGYLTEPVDDDLLFFGKDEPSVDLYVISLVGEALLGEALERIRDNRPLTDIPNCAYREGTGHVFSRRIDDIPGAEPAFVNWGELPQEFFDTGVVPLQTSKGCPFRCAFCNFNRDRRLMFVKPMDQLVQDLKTVSRRGARYVWFVDDNFRHGRSDLNEVSRRFIREGLDIGWMTMVRADTLKEVDTDVLRKSGCIELQLGLESADPGLLENMNKKAHPDLYREVVKNVLKAGINCSCYFIFGFPGETRETALQTRDFIKEIEHPELEGTLSWSLFPFSLYPMSPVYEVDQRKKYGLTGYLRNWRHDTMDSREAMEHARAAFFELDDSCPVYRGDNLDMLLDLSPSRRKTFLLERHRISKKALLGETTNREILDHFSKALPRSRGRSGRTGDVQPGKAPNYAELGASREKP